MSPYREDPRIAPPALPPKRLPVKLVLALSAVAHVTLLAACAYVGARADAGSAPLRAATVRVIGARATQMEGGETGWVLVGESDAWVRAPAGGE